MKKLIFTALVIITAISLTYAQESNPVPLYPNGIPNSKKAPAGYVEQTVNNVISKITDPAIVPFFPAKGMANGTAVIIVPGGAYSNSLYIEHEGYEAAAAFNKIGVIAFILKFRSPNDDIMIDRSIGPLQDAQTAIILVRKRAAEWGIDPARVGIVGFSGGGHVASTLGTHYNTPVIDNKDNISMRPAFMVLAYPVISFDGMNKFASDGLLGKTPTQAQIDLYSNEKQVTADTPPTFIVQAQDDNAVPVQNSLLFYEALTKAKVKAEMHIFQSGGHGFGLHNKKETKDEWFDWCKNWLDVNGFLGGK